ncbi:MAG: hypothetical protein R2850_00420 [Bacteroidia bacterium]
MDGIKAYDDYIFTIGYPPRGKTAASQGITVIYTVLSSPAVGDKELAEVLQLIPDVKWRFFQENAKYPAIEKM